MIKNTKQKQDNYVDNNNNIRRLSVYLLNKKIKMKKLLLAVLVLFGLQTQAQNNLCDSLSYTVYQGLPMMVYMEANGISNMVDSIEWYTTACNSVTCYLPQGNNPYSFPFINMTDTVKFCYDAYVYTQNQIITCTHCDSLIFDYTDSTYVLFSMSNTTSINELTFNRTNDGKIYDLLGKELNETPVGKLYIRNQKLYITR